MLIDLFHEKIDFYFRYCFYRHHKTVCVSFQQGKYSIGMTVPAFFDFEDMIDWYRPMMRDLLVITPSKPEAHFRPMINKKLNPLKHRP